MPAIAMNRHAKIEAASRSWVDDVRLGFLASVGVASANVLTLLVYGLQQKAGYSAVSAGFVGSSDLAGIALGSLIVALFARSLATARCIVFGFMIMGLFDIVSPAITGFWPLVIARFLHGAAGGAGLAALGAAIAASKSAERVIGATLVIQLSQSAIALIFMPPLIDRWGLIAVYLPMAVAALLGLALLPFEKRLLSSMRVAPAVRPIGVEQSAGLWSQVVPTLAIIGLFLFQESRFMSVSYGFAVGDFFHLDRAFVANTLGVSTWLGVFGSLFAFIIGGRFGQSLPILLTCVMVTVLNVVIIIGGHDRTIFMLTNSVGCVAVFFALPYVLGVCISIDGSGRLAVWSHFVSVAGLAVGPVLGGWVLSGFGMMPLLIVSASLFAAAVPFSLIPALAIDRARANGVARTRASTVSIA